MGNICCIGELLVDFICTDIDTDLARGENFSKHAGGAPANVTASIAKLGGSASFIGTVGNDPFGIFLKDTVEKTGVDTTMLLLSDKKPTTLAFVSLKADGERDFVFNRGADAELGFDELDFDRISDAQIVHFGSATALLDGRLQKTYLRLMDFCRKEKLFISFDPNFRGDLWKNNEDEFINLSLECIKISDFIKLSEEELFLLTGVSDLMEAVDLIRRPAKSILTVTLGSRGTLVSSGGESRIIDSIGVKSIDSTGAGDAFTGAFLLKAAELENPFGLYADKEKIREIITFSNKVGAIVCTKLGAIAALPTLDEVNSF